MPITAELLLSLGFSLIPSRPGRYGYKEVFRPAAREWHLRLPGL